MIQGSSPPQQAPYKRKWMANYRAKQKEKKEAIRVASFLLFPEDISNRSVIGP